MSNNKPAVPGREIFHKAALCPECECSQTLPVDLQQCSCPCHPMDREHAVPSSTRPQDIAHAIAMLERNKEPLVFEGRTELLARFLELAIRWGLDLERRNAELLEHLKICVQRLYVHQGATTRKIVADAQSVIERGAR